MTTAKPAMRPARPEFSSGPCAKRPGWSLQKLTDALLGRSHRSKIGKAKLKLPAVKQGTARNMNSVAKIAEMLA